MRKNNKGQIIITRRKAHELFLLFSNIRYDLEGKSKTIANKYYRELEDILGLRP